MSESESGIVIDPSVCGGRPVIKGTRIPAAIILELYEKGLSEDEICELYDLSLTKEDVKFVLEF